MVSLSDGEKKFEDMFIRFDVIHERDGRTDKQICYLNIVRQYADAR